MLNCRTREQIGKFRPGGDIPPGSVDGFSHEIPDTKQKGAPSPSIEPISPTQVGAVSSQSSSSSSAGGEEKKKPKEGEKKHEIPPSIRDFLNKINLRLDKMGDHISAQKVKAKVQEALDGKIPIEYVAPGDVRLDKQEAGKCIKSSDGYLIVLIKRVWEEESGIPILPNTDWYENKPRILDENFVLAIEHSLELTLVHEFVHVAQEFETLGSLASELEAYDFMYEYRDKYGLNKYVYDKKGSYYTIRSRKSDIKIADETRNIDKQDKSSDFKALDPSKTTFYRDRAKKSLTTIRNKGE